MNGDSCLGATNVPDSFIHIVREARTLGLQVHIGSVLMDIVRQRFCVTGSHQVFLIY